MTTFRSMNLQVGARLQMVLQNGANQAIYYTDLIGYVLGEYLIVKIPFENGLSILIQESEQVALRILSGMDVFSFTCNVKSIFKAPHYYMHLSFPVDIQSIPLRSAIRAKVNLPVQIHGIDDAAIINDISITGAGIISDKALGELNEETTIFFEFAVKSIDQMAQINTKATLRSIQPLPNKNKDIASKFLHGVAFHELDLVSRLMLLNFVYESMNK